MRLESRLKTYERIEREEISEDDREIEEILRVFVESQTVIVEKLDQIITILSATPKPVSLVLSFGSPISQ
jgi:hypothetical protein